VVITGTLPDICHAKAMAGYLGARSIRLSDYPRWAEPLRNDVRANAERLATEAGLQIEFVRKLKAFRKEDRVLAILAERGARPGPVHVFSAMEACSSYRPWHDKASGKTLFKPITGKCLHGYFYFIDAQFGLCYMRVPTWAPFRLQVYFNGHGWLARQPTQTGIDFDVADNAFLRIAEPDAARRLADGPEAATLHRHLDAWAQRFCPVLGHFRNAVHWSFMQVEYATDAVFHKQAKFQPLYEAIVRTAVHVVKAEHVATFLGHKLTAHSRGEVGNDFSTRIQGTRIRHHMGPASIKLYDKEGAGQDGRPGQGEGRSLRGFDLFLDPDYQLFRTLARGEWSISGFRARDLRQHIDELTPSRVSYLIKRLRTHGLIKKVGHAYKYFFTKLGRRVVTTALVIRENFVQPNLAGEAL
jgi:hypothetical protein